MKLMLIDVDDTLYPKGTGPFRVVSERINDYVMEWCRLGPADTRVLRDGYVRKYGSTLGGLMEHYGVDPDHYLKKVHDVPVEDLLTHDERLRESLRSVQGEMVAFSNGSVHYVRRVLDALGVRDLFSDLFTIEFMDFIPKPRSYPYRKAMELYSRSPDDCILVDDRLPNVRTAIELGMETIIVAADSPVEGARMIPDIYSLPRTVYF